MNIKELLAIVQRWHEVGLEVQCNHCGEDIVIGPEDEGCACKNCDSTFEVKRFIIEKMEG
jgi:transposase-like protein